MNVQITNPATVHPTAGYSHAAEIGNLVFVSGQVSKNARDEMVGIDDAEKQTEMVYENLRLVLEECGSGMDLIGKAHRIHHQSRASPGNQPRA
jgi:enamine deaminase RidA (YjgF/YER057c/UK114 family)